MVSTLCSICEKKNDHTLNFNDSDENNVKWLTKLQSIVPEVQEQSEECLICNICIDHLEEVLKFRDQLLQLVLKQRIKFTQNHDVIIYVQKSQENQDDENQQQCVTIELKETTNNEPVGREKMGTLYSNENETDDECVSTCNKYICHLCALELISEEDLSNHLKVCELEYKTKTGQINDIPNTEKELIATTQKRRGRNPSRIFKCELCSQQFNYIKDIIKHCTSLHSMEEKSIKPYHCDKCPQRFTSNANYDQHQKYHNRNRDYVCSLCGKGFITKSDLMVHEYTHLNRRNYQCSKCDKAFNTNKNLRTHILVVHTDRSSWKYTCSLCEKRFPLKSGHEQHMRRHSGDKQHICHICKKAFITASELKRHITLHSNIRPFKCEYCKKDYKTFRTLNTHLKQSHSVGDAVIPTREKKYVCHICPSQFYDKQKLARHLCGHSGVKPFGCSSCGKRFTDKSYLKHHLKVYHDIVELNT